LQLVSRPRRCHLPGENTWAIQISFEFCNGTYIPGVAQTVLSNPSAVTDVIRQTAPHVVSLTAVVEYIALGTTAPGCAHPSATKGQPATKTTTTKTSGK
jgi:hypothetical protein